MKKMTRLFKIIGLSLLVLSCNRFEMESPADEARNPSLMRFAASYPLAQTRADEAGFADGDKMGVFVTDYENGSPGVLKTDGNRADNVRFTFDESSMSWTGATDIYWKDDKTPVDIYGYYPFDEDLSDVEDYRFSVSVRQDAAPTGAEPGGYEASDLLWAKSENVHPTSEIVTLTYGHMMAGVKVILQMGEGFEEAEWASLSKTVLIRNVVADASVNLTSGIVIPERGTDRKSIKPCLHNGEYRAVVVPQTVEAGNELVSITVNGVGYSFVRQDVMTYSPGKMHKFTIKVDKHSLSGDYEFTMVEESVSAWKDDSYFVDGLTRNYITIHVHEPDLLWKIIRDKGLEPGDITSLKLTGLVGVYDYSPTNRTDADYIKDSLPSLQNLNLKDARLYLTKMFYHPGGIPRPDTKTWEPYDVLPFGFLDGAPYLQHIVLPDILKRIDDSAFESTGISGTTIVPEGVTEIDDGAFSYCMNLTEISLPSTLIEIGMYAFKNSSLTGTLGLPNSLQTIGPMAFAGNNLSGTLILPENLTEVSYETFYNNAFTGDLIIPDKVVKIGDSAFKNNDFDGVLILPDGLYSIGGWAFAGTSFIGELLLPSNLRELGEEAFSGTRFTKVLLPETLSYIGRGAFLDCSRIQGTVTVPDNIVKIPESCFRGCTGLGGVVLGVNLSSIDENAFAYCHNLTSVVCMAEEPPVLAENAFEGVPRDNFTIEVPAGSVDKYKRAEGWREFKRIAEYSDFVCRPATSCALNSSRRQTLVLNADGPWTVSHLPEWCLVSPLSGDGKTEVTLTINELAHGTGHRADSVVFTLVDGGHKTWCKVSQYDYEYEEDEVIALQKATKGKGVDVIFLGDGWDGEAIANGSYLALVQEQVEHFFGVEPYTTYRDYFNVYAGIALSQETGVNTLNTYRDTRFMTLYGGAMACKGIEAHLSVERNAVFDYVTGHSPIQHSDLWKSLVVLVPNSTHYGGCTYVYNDGSTISICCPSEYSYPNDTRGIIQHEAGGHGFGKLGDEMIMKNGFPDEGTKYKIEDFHHRGMYQNVAISGKMSDVPWSHFIFDPEYSDYVDIFEGAMGFTRGVWRSEQNSCMNYGIPYYNAISRQEIMRRILDYSGEGFTMEKFYATDSKKWGNSSPQTRVIPDQAYTENAWHSAPYYE